MRTILVLLVDCSEFEGVVLKWEGNTYSNSRW